MLAWPMNTSAFGIRMKTSEIQAAVEHRITGFKLAKSSLGGIHARKLGKTRL
jgi:hypothetical protein